MKQPITGDESAARVEVGGRAINVTRSLGQIDFDNLQREISDSGGNAVWWGVLHAQAIANLGRAKQQRDVTKATVARDFRRARIELLEKVTEAGIAEEVILNASVRAAEHAIIDAEEHVNILRAAAFACSEKQRACTALAETRREIYATSDPAAHLRGPRVEDRRGKTA